jgi:hypothetical protein
MLPTMDVVIYANAAVLAPKAQGLLSGFPPVQHRIELGTDLWIGRLPGDLAKTVMDTCEPTALGTPKPVRQFAQLYAFVHDLTGAADIYKWDADSRLYKCVALSRLIHPTSVGFRYAARVRYGESEPVAMFPAEFRGVSIDTFLSDTHERDWLTKSEAVALRELIARAELLFTPKFPSRVSRALWYYDYAIRTYYADLRWTLVSAALEALVHTGRTASTRHFRRRLPQLAVDVGAMAITEAEADLAYDYRSRLSHGEGFLADLPTADAQLYDKLENTLRLTVLRALRDPGFADTFCDDASITKRWPV